MTAYMIFLREEPVRDQAELDEYSRQNRASAGEFVKNFKMAPLVVYGALEAVEGPTPDGVVLLQFPSVEDAKAWYNSPAYQSALQHRLKGADYRAIIMQGL